MSLLIKHATILTQDSHRRRLHGDLLIENETITQISETPITVEADYKIDGKNKLVLPGLINTHTHLPMTLLRGYGDDRLLQDWLEHCIWPVEARLTTPSIQSGAALGALELIASGTTTFLDMYFFEEIIASVTKKSGLRGYLGFGVLDLDTAQYKADELLPACERFIKTWRKDPLIHPVVAPHSAYTCAPESLTLCKDLATKYDILLHSHCSETRDEVYDLEKRYGKRPVEQFNSLGLLTPRMILAHCGWITKTEIATMKEAGCAVAHCPVSNYKIGTGGYAPVPEMLAAGLRVSLGTDGAASNNILDMFDTMKFAALGQKQHRWDPRVLPAQTVFDFSTIGGAACLGIQDQVGSLEIGKQADVILIDLHQPHLTPVHDPVSHLVYAVRGGDVCTTIVNGRPLMLDHEFLTLDPEETMASAARYASELTN